MPVTVMQIETRAAESGSKIKLRRSPKIDFIHCRRPAPNVRERHVISAVSAPDKALAHTIVLKIASPQHRNHKQSR